jgi:SnoaL-like domain
MPMTPQETAQHLYELEQIKQTKARYFRCLDTKQWADWRTCFTDDLHFYLGQDPNPVATSANEFVAYVSKLLADTVTVHHGHMPEIALTSATTATGIWAMFDWVDWSQTATPERTFQGYGHYNEEYEKGADGRWRIKRLHLTRLRVDHPTPQP